jgi:hypothetical protein
VTRWRASADRPQRRYHLRHLDRYLSRHHSGLLVHLAGIEAGWNRLDGSSPSARGSIRAAALCNPAGEVQQWIFLRNAWSGMAVRQRGFATPSSLSRSARSGDSRARSADSILLDSPSMALPLKRGRQPYTESCFSIVMLSPQFSVVNR